MNPFEQDLDQLYREAKRLEMEFDERISALEKEYHECLDELYKRIEGVERGSQEAMMRRRGLTTPALFMPTGFPRILYAGRRQ